MVKGVYLMGGLVCIQTTVILILKIFGKIGAVPFTLFVDSKYFMLLTPCASCHSSPPHRTKHQTWHCLCYACPFHPCSSFNAKETLPYVTVGTTPAVLKVPITSLFPSSLISCDAHAARFCPSYAGPQWQRHSQGSC